MAIVQWEPYRDAWDLRRSMNRLFEDFYPSRSGNGGTQSWAMPLDVYYTDDSLVIKASLPGVKADDIDVTVTGNTLTIKGESRSQHDARENDYICNECHYGSYSRTLTLSDGVDTAKIDANLEDGVLTLTIPKSAEKKPKQIKVKAVSQIEEGKKGK